MTKIEPKARNRQKIPNSQELTQKPNIDPKAKNQPKLQKSTKKAKIVPKARNRPKGQKSMKNQTKAKS